MKFDVSSIISVDEAIREGNYKWSKGKNDCEFLGVVPGYICGFCIEAEKDGKVDYSSVIYTNDCNEFIVPEYDSHEWNGLGLAVENMLINGWNLTCRLVFRGYNEERYDPDEREEYFINKSEEVVALWNDYVVNFWTKY